MERCETLRKAILPARASERLDIELISFELFFTTRSRALGNCGTGKETDEVLLKIINDNFDLRPGCIIRDLKLTTPIYQRTAAYGHFGRDDYEFEWEKPRTLVMPGAKNE